MISTPTRDHNFLDLLFTDQPNLISSINVDAPFTSTCDHNVIKFTLDIQNSPKQKNKAFRDFGSADYEKINAYLSKLDWKLILGKSFDINSLYNKFIQVIWDCILNFIPINTRNKKTFKFPSHILRLRHYKNILWHKGRRIDNNAKFRKVSKDLDREIKKFLRNSEKNFINRNPKNLFRLIKTKKGHQINIPSLINDGKVMTSDFDKAQHFMETFYEVYTSPSFADVSSLTTPQQTSNSKINSYFLF